MDRKDFLNLLGVGSLGILSAKGLISKNEDNKFNPIVGSWFEFQHHSKVEATYWNTELKNMSCKDWELKIKEMADAGIEYLVLLCVALRGKSFYPSKLLPSYDLICKDPLGMLLDTADKYDIKAFVSNGYFGNWKKPYSLMRDPKIRKLRLKAMNEIAENYGHNKSFYGWYYPNEFGLDGHFKEFYIDYVNEASDEVAKLMPQAKTLIAPYGTRNIIYDKKFLKQIESLNVDYMAFQDEVGVEKSTPFETTKYFKKLSTAFKKVGRSDLWADCEVFSFQGKRYNSPLIPGPPKRVVKQLNAIAPSVDKIFIYEYDGLINAPNTEVFLGYPGDSSKKLYIDLAKNHYLS